MKRDDCHNRCRQQSEQTLSNARWYVLQPLSISAHRLARRRSDNSNTNSQRLFPHYYRIQSEKPFSLKLLDQYFCPPWTLQSLKRKS